jgi:uncharacterized membrane protein
MKNLSLELKAKVSCVDGPAGILSHIIVNPVNGQVTFLGVETDEDTEKLVPIDQVESTDVNEVTLSSSLEQLANLPAFAETHFVRNDLKDYDQADLLLPYSVPMATDFLEVEESNIPEGQLSFHRGTDVEATDGWVGTIDEFIVSPDSGAITHFVLREGNVWSKKHLTLPVSVVERVFDDVVYLKVNKASLKDLPTIPVRRSWGYWGADIELVVLVYDKAGKANEALSFLKDLKREKLIARIRNSAVLVKDVNGNISIKEAQDVDKRQGAIFGAITGGLVGMLGGPIGAVIGAAAGAATGRVAADKIDMGFSNDYLEALQESLQPDSSAIIALVEHEWTGTVTDTLAEHGGKVFRQALPDEILSQILAETPDTESDTT